MTGGSKGIGEGCVRVFFEAGSNVVFCSRGEAEGQALAAELNSHSSQGQRAVMVKADVSKVSLHSRMFPTSPDWLCALKLCFLSFVHSVSHATNDTLAIVNIVAIIITGGGYPESD